MYMYIGIVCVFANDDVRTCMYTTLCTGLAEVYRFAKRIYAALKTKYPSSCKTIVQ